MKTKKLVALVLVAVLAITSIVGTTLAYFKDTDSAKNVMTTGNVKIEQIEQQRDEQGNLEEFEDDKKLFPITKPFNYDKEVVIVDGQKARPLADNDYNVVDKIVTVKNIGTEEAYARTLFAFEMLALEKDDQGNVTKWDYAMNGMNGPVVISTISDIYGSGMATVVNEDGEWVTFELNGNKYAVCEYYHGELAKDEISVPSLLQVYLKSDVGNEFYDYVGEEYEILTLTQATQKAGFTDCRQALETAFGKVAEANLVEWFNGVE